jgi:hypothetical protein
MHGEWRERDRNPTSFPASMVAVNGGAVTLTLPRAHAALPACTSLAPCELGPEKMPMKLASDEPGSMTTFASRQPGPGA